jgi:predicted DNA-binding transcriptional regulator AlpA
MQKATLYLTITEIAERLGVARHRVVYALRQNQIPHAVEIGDRVGYGVDVIEIVRERLLIDKRFAELSEYNYSR